MIKHIVMWKIDNGYSIDEKEGLIETFSKKLMGLEGAIPELKSISVHRNSTEAAESNFDLLLETTFESIDDLNTYQVHPIHQEVVKFGKSFKKERACVDFNL